MTTLAEILDAAKNGKSINIPVLETKKRRFSSRRYDIIGYRLNGETIEHKNVSANAANNLRADLRKNGCHRVDKIEVQTRILDGNNERTNLVFTEKNYQPALVGKIPATVSASDRKIADDRRRMNAANFFKMAAKDNLIKSDNIDKIVIYDKVNGRKIRNNKGRFISVPKLVFSGTEAEAIFYLMNNIHNISNFYVYLPEKKNRKGGR